MAKARPTARTTRWPAISASPLATDLSLWFDVIIALLAKVANSWRAVSQCEQVGQLNQVPLHVTLTAADPDFATVDILTHMWLPVSSDNSTRPAKR